MTAVVDIQLVPHPIQGDATRPEFPLGFPPDAGAECVFIGRTRAEAHPVHGPLVRLDYHAYEAMAATVLRALADRAIADYGCSAVRIHHATGPVAIGEASVLVQVACGHRDKAFAACRMLIDRLKAEAPVWKREVWSDGATWSQGTPVAMERHEDRGVRHVAGSPAS